MKIMVWFEQTLIQKNTMIGICPKYRVACDYVVVNKQGELKVVITVTIRQCPITGLKRAPSSIHLRHSECTKPADKSANQFHWNLCWEWTFKGIYRIINYGENPDLSWNLWPITNLNLTCAFCRSSWGCITESALKVATQFLFNARVQCNIISHLAT